VVRRALAVLEPRERDLVALKFAGGLSNVEIAKVIGLSPSNTGTKLHRAVEKLREACREEL
jgi:RNA polymerase sigma-70 factor (ECF subfamily)